ncbi:MAG TPA: hypothetical protein PKA74_19550, partial [Bauldia sp.]|nr:hypothetical protein [Bauldia sp.]
ELDPLDAAIVSLKVLTRLLDAAVPGGPAALKGKQAVSVSEGKVPLEVSTPTASSRFNAPWTLKGTVERLDAGKVSFALEIEAPYGEKAGGGATCSRIALKDAWRSLRSSVSRSVSGSGARAGAAGAAARPFPCAPGSKGDRPVTSRASSTSGSSSAGADEDRRSPGGRTESFGS